MRTRPFLESDIAWMSAHSMELSRQYAGRWIAVHGGAVIGVGMTAKDAADQARTRCGDGEFILEAVEADVDFLHVDF